MSWTPPQSFSEFYRSIHPLQKLVECMVITLQLVLRNWKAISMDLKDFMSLPLLISLTYDSNSKTDCIRENRAQHTSVYIVAMISWLENCMLHNSLLTNSSTTNENLPLLKTRKTQDNTKQRQSKRMFSKKALLRYKLHKTGKFALIWQVLSFDQFCSVCWCLPA